MPLHSYIVQTTEMPRDPLAALLVELIGPEVEEQLMSTYTKIKQEGRIEILLRLLTARFGPLSQEAEQKVHNASAKTLERWAIAVLDAKTLEQVFAS